MPKCLGAGHAWPGGRTSEGMCVASIEHLGGSAASVEFREVPEARPGRHLRPF